MEAAISAQNLAIGYKTGNLEVVVGNIPSLTLQQGKLTCLLGANGVGKSTLLKTITGNLQPIAGDIRIKGRSLVDLTVKEKARQIAVVLTDKAHLGFTTVKEMITLGRNPYTNWMNTLGVRDSEAIDKALNAIGMADFADRPLTELSDGNLQKVIIGRAIAQETDIIVLDEPTIHLDITNKSIIVELLQNLCREHNKTILFSTHDLELAKLYADQLWIMQENSIIHGLTEDIILDNILEKSLKFNPNINDSSFANLVLQGPRQVTELVTRALTKAALDKDIRAEITVKKDKGTTVFLIDERRFAKLAEVISFLAQRVE